METATVSTNRQGFQPGNRHSVGHGAPKGNANNFRAGLKFRRRLAVGKLPKGCSWINSLIGEFRRELERCVFDAHGVVDYKAALIVQSACRHEQAALLAQRWLRLQSESMTHSERLTYLQAIAAESDKRDRCIGQLKLDVDPQTIVSALYGPVTALDAVPATENTKGDES